MYAFSKCFSLNLSLALFLFFLALGVFGLFNNNNKQMKRIEQKSKKKATTEEIRFPISLFEKYRTAVVLLLLLLLSYFGAAKHFLSFTKKKGQKQQQRQQQTIAVETRKLIKWKLNFGRLVRVCIIHNTLFLSRYFNSHLFILFSSLSLFFASFLFKSFRFYLISTIRECQTPIDNNKNRFVKKIESERERDLS